MCGAKSSAHLPKLPSSSFSFLVRQDGGVVVSSWGQNDDGIGNFTKDSPRY